MSTSRLFDVDAEGGIRTMFHFDPVGEGYWLESVQDVSPIIEFNQAAMNDAPDRFGGDMVRVASIPNTIFAELQRQGITDDPVKMAQWLNDRDNQKFRVHGGRV